MALAVCLLLDPAGDRAVRRLLQRLENAGIPTLLSHTHGRHHPHLSYAALRSYDIDAVTDALAALPEAPPTRLYLDGLGLFRRSRCWLVPALTSDLVARQEAVVSAAAATGAELHRHYGHGVWIPHVTLAPRLRLQDLPVVAQLVYDALPLVVDATRTALVDTGSGTVHALPHLL